MTHSINFKLLAVITSAFVFTGFCILMIADLRLTQISDTSQEAIFKEKIDTIWDALYRKNTSLKKTGMVETYIEDFQDSSISAFRAGYYRIPDQPIYPFIIDLKGKVVSHPQFSRGADAMAGMGLPERMLTLKSGAFEHTLAGKKNWTAFRLFDAWGWIVGYTIPMEIKYADARAFNNTLVLILLVVSFLVLVALFIIITRFTRPIVRLTAISTQIAAGHLDQEIHTGGRDEVATLSQSFARMRDAIKDQIAALRAEKRRVDNIIKGTNAGTWDWLIPTGELVVNRRWAEMIGSRFKGPMHIDQWKQGIHPEDRLSLKKALEGHFEGDTEYFKADYRQRHSAGYWVWVATHGKVVEREGDGSPVRMSGTHLDITENKKNEAEREELEGQLRQAQKMEAVGRLAGGVAHDFNNMLSVIIGQAELALDEVDPDLPLYGRLEEIKKAGERSGDLTRQLLAFARKQTVSPKVIDLNNTVAGMTKMLQRLIGEDIELAWLPSPETLTVKIDPGQIDQILANLCVNARDAIEDVGKITIETDRTEFDDEYCQAHLGFLPGRYVLFAVSDNGCGMDAETLPLIFEPFFTQKKAGRGTGLGLATVYGIVKQNKGFINVYSEPGHGTTFKIYLPEHVGLVDGLPKEPEPAPPGSAHETILLVEDEPAILQMAQKMLERMGYDVVTANSPGEAVRLARKHTARIHLLLTDVIMPEMNGRDLEEKILSLYPDMRSLFMSGYTSDVIARHGVLDQGIHFISKPFSAGTLGSKIREVLDGKKG